jgi:hypothetical protein
MPRREIIDVLSLYKTPVWEIAEFLIVAVAGTYGNLYAVIG